MFKKKVLHDARLQPIKITNDFNKRDGLQCNKSLPNCCKNRDCYAMSYSLIWPHGVWKSQKKSQFKITSEASYVYILSGQKLIKNAQNDPFWRVFENLKLAVKQCYQTGQF